MFTFQVAAWPTCMPYVVLGTRSFHTSRKWAWLDFFPWSSSLRTKVTTPSRRGPTGWEWVGRDTQDRRRPLMMNMQVPVKNIFFPFSGTNNVCVISTDEYGRMHPDVLEREIKELIRVGEKIPLMVNATFGTTVLGAIDPIDVSLIQAKELALEIECLFFLLISGNCQDLPRTRHLAPRGRLLGRLTPCLAQI